MIECVKILLERGASVNLKNVEGNSALISGIVTLDVVNSLIIDRLY